MCWVNTPETLLTYSHMSKGLRKISGVHYQRLSIFNNLEK